MTENFELALQLLVVGMLTVFFILGIVTGLARILIILVNKFFPQSDGKIIKKSKSIEQKNLVIIASVVELITKGKGVVRSINKLN